MNKFTPFYIPGSRDKWRHLWLKSRHKSYRTVLSAEKHVQFVLTAQRREQTAQLKEDQKPGMLHAEDYSYSWTWRKVRKSPGGKRG